jgi:hypothetical protein
MRNLLTHFGTTSGQRSAQITRWRRALATLVTTAVLGILMTLAAAAPAQAASCVSGSTLVLKATHYNGSLYAGQALHTPYDVATHPGSGWYSNVLSYYGHYVLSMQDDGNLVMYRIHYVSAGYCGGEPEGWIAYDNLGAVWSTNTVHWYRPQRTVALMQADGNVVLYDGNTPIWSANSNGNGTSYRYRLTVQDDSNLVVYLGNAAVWDRR